LAYTLAGADCIDVAADPAVIAAAKDALKVAEKWADAATARGYGIRGLPWLMVSLNDGEDPHFRKAEFNPAKCPPDCTRPCESICPAQAIALPDTGVIDERCYGCGRCVPVCPIGQIVTRSYVYTPEAIAHLVLSLGIDALEIHTQVGHLEDFKRLWCALAPWVEQLKLIAISCPDGDGLIDYLKSLYKVMTPLPCPLIWQTDGRPMSGDIGIGTTRAAVKLGEKVLAANLPGYVQLAGGTNHHTVPKLQAAELIRVHESEEIMNVAQSSVPTGFEQKLSVKDKGDLLNLPLQTQNSVRAGEADQSGVETEQSFNIAPPTTQNSKVAGIAYGSYARVLLSPVLDRLEKINKAEAYANAPSLPSVQRVAGRLEETPQLLWEAVAQAHSLVSPLKSLVKGKSTHCG
jgi:Fe-S-cluster-containing hydrogenase component 2